MKKLGISLIVLVVTIIVMIILAGTIITSLSDTDIIDKAETAVKNNNLAEIKSISSMAYAEYLLNNETGSVQQYIRNKLQESGMEEKELHNYFISKTGNVEIIDMGEDDESEPFITEWTIPNANTEITLPITYFTGLNMTLDWGDDSAIETYTEATISESPSHTYANAGIYDITIKGECRQFDFSVVGDENSQYLTSIKSWGTTGIGREMPADNTSISFSFRNCTNLEIIPIPNEKTFEATLYLGALFSNCTKIEEIPESLFANAPNLINISGAFQWCSSLKTIPTNLITNCPNIQRMAATFNSCTALTGEAPNYWDNANIFTYNYCFTGCAGLSNYNEIPTLWKN